MVLKKLLKTKNRCLLTLLRVTEDFLFKTKDKNFDELEQFQKTREKILRIVEHVDSKISKIVASMRAELLTDLDRQEIQTELDQKNIIVSQILRADEKIMKNIEAEISSVLEVVKASEKSKNAISKFKSEWVAKPGKELDQTL